MVKLRLEIDYRLRWKDDSDRHGTPGLLQFIMHSMHSVRNSAIARSASHSLIACRTLWFFVVSVLQPLPLSGGCSGTPRTSAKASLAITISFPWISICE